MGMNHQINTTMPSSTEATTTTPGLDPDTSIIAIIGAGISGLATVLQILLDQQHKPPPKEDDPPIEDGNVMETGLNCHPLPQRRNHSNHPTKKTNNKKKKNKHSDGRRLCRTIQIYETHAHPTNMNPNDEPHHRMGYGLTMTYQPQHSTTGGGILFTNTHHDPNHNNKKNDENESSISSTSTSITNYDCPSRSHYMLNSNGTVLGYYGNAFHSTTNERQMQHDDDDAGGSGDDSGGYGQRGNIRIPRQVLCQLLYQRIQSIVQNDENDHVYPTIEWYYHHTLRSIQEEVVDVKVDTTADTSTTTTTKVRLTFDTANTHASTSTANSNTNRPIPPLPTTVATTIVDLVIAADGIHSTVARQWLQPPTPISSSSPPPPTATTTHTTEPSPPPIQHLLSPPKSLHVRIILGITNDLRNIITAPDSYSSHNTTTITRNTPIHIRNGSSHHELIHECGFYTLAHGHRLFVMPYTGSTLNRSYDPNEPVRFMWQLSFLVPHGDDRADGGMYSSLPPHTVPRYTALELQQEALKRTHDWHAPVTTLITQTSPSNIWGTMLRDRDPNEIGTLLLVPKQTPNKSSQPQQYINPKVQRVIIIGDAMHGMSPFKGQGANQCIKDAVCVSKWLYKLGTRNLRTAIQFMTREIIQRTTPIVLASRQAAEYWHTIPIPTNHPSRHNISRPPLEGGGNDADFTFAGIVEDDTDLKQELLMELQNRNINAGTTQHLDATIRNVLLELCHRRRQKARTSSHVFEQTTDVINPSTPMSGPSIADRGRHDTIPNENGSKRRPHPGTNPTSDQRRDGTTIATSLAMIIDMAYRGNTDALRQVSWYQPNYLRQLKVYRVDCTNGTTGTYNDPVLWNNAVVEGNCSSDDTLSNHITNDPPHWTTILHVAIIGGHSRTIHWLITEAGCHLNAKDCWERTVFDISKQRQQPVIPPNGSTTQNREEIQELLHRLQLTSYGTST